MNRAIVAIAIIIAIVVVLGVRSKPHTPPTPNAGAVSGSASISRVARSTARDLAAPAIAPSAARVTQLTTLSWGSGRGQAGRRVDPESPGEGPMAIAAGKHGDLYVLDQIQGRVLHRDRNGQYTAPIPIGGSTAQDLRVDEQGGLAVLDRLGTRSIERYDADGKLTSTQSLTQIVRDTGGTTGLYEDEDGAMYVEESLAGEGRRVLHPLAGGDPLPGRPNGRTFLAAAITDRANGGLVLRDLDAGGAVLFQTPLSVARSILAIALCDADAAGGIYVGVIDATTRGTDLVDEQLDLFRLDPTGTPVAHVALPHPTSTLESFRELSVAGVGIVWWMHTLPGDAGIVVDEIRL